MVFSGGGDPLCVSSSVISSCAVTGAGAATRFRGRLRLAALAVLAVGRRFGAERCLALVRRLVVVRRLAALGRFGVDRFLRDEREVAARFLRFAISTSLSGRTL